MAVMLEQNKSQIPFINCPQQDEESIVTHIGGQTTELTGNSLISGVKSAGSTNLERVITVMFSYVFPSKLLTYIICNLNTKDGRVYSPFPRDKNISELLPHLTDGHINERIYTSKWGSLPELVKKKITLECFQTHQLPSSADNTFFTNRTVKLREHFLQDKLLPIKVVITKCHLSTQTPFYWKKGYRQIMISEDLRTYLWLKTLDLWKESYKQQRTMHLRDMDTSRQRQTSSCILPMTVRCYAEVPGNQCF